MLKKYEMNGPAYFIKEATSCIRSGDTQGACTYFVDAVTLLNSELSSKYKEIQELQEYNKKLRKLIKDCNLRYIEYTEKEIGY
jgi:hypothetical protein